MILPPDQHVRVLASRLNQARALSEWLSSDRCRAGAKVLKDSERSSVLLVEAPLEPLHPERRARLVVKSLAQRVPRDLVAGVLHRSRGWRQWKGADRVRRRGLDAAEPLLLFRGRRSAGGIGEPGGWVETLVLEYEPGRTLLEHIAHPEGSARAQHTSARAVGLFTRRLADQWLLNRDHKPSNIVMVEREGGYAPTLIDTAGVRSLIGSPLGETLSALAPAPTARAARRHEALLCRMLASLVIEPLGVGKPARAGLRWRALRATFETPAFGSTLKENARARGVLERREEMKARWRRVARLVAAHGDPTPRDDPFG